MFQKLWRIGLALCTALCLLACCGGCWSGRELGKLLVVMGVGLDADPSGQTLQVTAQAAKAADMGKTEGGSGPAYWNLNSSGTDPFTALRRMTGQAGKQLYLSHNQVLVIGRELAEQGVQDALDYFLRDRENRTNVWVIVADGTAADLLDFEPAMERLPARQLAEQIKSRSDTGEWPAVDLLEFTNQLMERSRAPVAPLVALIQDGDAQTAQVVGTAVFRDDQMTGSLNAAETRGMLWSTGEVESAALQADLEGDQIAVEMVSATGALAPVLGEDGSVTMRVEIHAEGYISAQSGDRNFADPQNVDRLEESLCQTIRAEVEAAFQKAQALRTDIYGLGNRIHEKYPHIWEQLEENWHDRFSQVTLETKVDVRVSSTGRLVEPTYP